MFYTIEKTDWKSGMGAHGGEEDVRGAVSSSMGELV